MTIGIGGKDFGRYAHLDASRVLLSDKRLGIVGDRDFPNVWNLADSFLTRDDNPARSISLGALIVPGGEFDYYVSKIAQLGQSSSFKIMGMPIDLGNGTMGMHFLSEEVDFYFLHHPLDPQALKGDSNYRKRWSSELADLMDFAHCGRIVLANNKIILDEGFVERNEGNIVNLHPSKLPERKGWRTERTGLIRQTPRSAGWTAHNVTPELDRGETIAFQNVPLEPGSENFRSLENQDQFEVEERQRLRGFRAQSHWVSEILNLHFSGVPRITLRGREAFAREGRESFFQSKSYNQLMEIGERPDLYGRFLYGELGQEKTAEEIIGMPAVAPYERVDKLAMYTYELRATGVEGVKIQSDLMDFSSLACTGSVYHTEGIAMRNGRFRGSILTVVSLADELERRGIGFIVEEFPTLVVGPRKEIQWVPI